MAQKDREALSALSKSKGRKSDSSTGADNRSKPSKCLMLLENIRILLILYRHKDKRL